MPTPEWIPALFAAIDDRNADAFASRLTSDVIFRFGNAPAVQGLEAVRDAVEAFFASIAGLRHELVDVWDTGDAVICRGTVTYTRRDGGRLQVPFANILKVEANRVREYLIFVDASELYAERPS